MQDEMTDAFDDFQDMAAAAYSTADDTQANPFSSTPLPPPIPDPDNEIFRGFTHSEMSTAFKRIQSPNGWKWPIYAVIAADEWVITDAATVFFTGSNLELVEWGADQALIVKARGYYEAIGA